MIPKYKTNLTIQQYRSYEGRLYSFSKKIGQNLKNKEITLNKAKELILDYAKKLGLLISDEKEEYPHILRTEEVFEDNNKEYKPSRFEEKQSYEKSPDLQIPKQFFMSGGRTAPCQIVKNQNIRVIMKGSVEYADKVGREVHYTLCETPSSIKVSSPSFGKKYGVSSRSERTANKCLHEFGKKSKEIGEFHTHPGINSSDFSITDLSAFVWKDTGENIGDSRCVVSKIKAKEGKEKIRVRCTTSRDTTRFLDSVKYKGMDRSYKGLPNILYNKEAKSELDYRFSRDPDIQNAFTCTVDINGTKPKRSEEYDGKIISKKEEKIIRKKKLKQKIKSRPTQSEDIGILGLGRYF